MSGTLLPKMLEQLETGLLGHVQISDDDAIAAVLAERLAGRRAVRHGAYSVPVAFQHLGKQLPAFVVIVDDQNLWQSHGSAPDVILRTTAHARFQAIAARPEAIDMVDVTGFGGLGHLQSRG